jgi:hypothetical protein
MNLTDREIDLVLMAVTDKAEIREFRFGDDDPLAKELREISEKLQQRKNER